MTQTAFDTIDTFPCGSLVHHGHFNDRAYLMTIGAGATDSLPMDLIEFARRKGYGKIIAKLPDAAAEAFRSAGYIKEAATPGFYRGAGVCRFVAYYLDDARRTVSDPAALDAVRIAALERAAPPSAPPVDPSLTVRRLTESDAVDLADVFRNVFKTYPFPIFDPSYLTETMRSHIAYYGIERDGALAAVSSAEMDLRSSAAEMTDFATLPNQRGRGLALRLLASMEADMSARGIQCAFTIARAASPGMNITFAKRGYRYDGRLENNTNIAGRIESMNVWSRPLNGIPATLASSR